MTAFGFALIAAAVFYGLLMLWFFLWIFGLLTCLV